MMEHVVLTFLSMSVKLLGALDNLQDHADGLPNAEMCGRALTVVVPMKCAPVHTLLGEDSSRKKISRRGHDSWTETAILMDSCCRTSTLGVG